MSQMIILKIKDRKYGMYKMSPLEGAPFGLRVAKMVSTILGAPKAKESLELLMKRFSGENSKETSLSMGEAMTIGASIVSLLSGIDPEELNAIFKKAIKSDVFFEDIRLGDDSEFDMHFQKFPGDLYVVCGWATYNHVHDFFSGIGDGVKALMTNSELSNPGQR